MKVTVIIPHYNCEKYIVEAVMSVHVQKEHVSRLRVVDDGSEEERWVTAISECNKYEFEDECWSRLTENRGQGTALNYALCGLTTDVELVAFLDADDVWAPHKLALQLEVMKDPNIDACYGYAQEFRGEWPSREMTAPVPAPLLSGLCVRRDVLMDYPFGERLGAGMTIEWFSRATDYGVRFHRMPEVLYYRRIHDQNYGVRRRREAVTEYLSALQKIEQRRKHDKTHPR